MFDSSPRDTFGHVVQRLNDYRLAYAHIMRSLAESPEQRSREVPIAFFRDLYQGTLITNGRFDFHEADRFIRDGVADAVAFGTLALANPDLSARFASIAKGQPTPLNTPNPATFYTDGPVGYTDYPTLAAAPLRVE
jgi:N-ethylmaleimide reductase